MARSLIGWFAGRNRMTLIAGAVGAAALSLGTTASLGGFSASITNTGDSVATGTLIMKENVTPAGGSVNSCLSTASGTSVSSNANTGCGSNKFGNITNGVPGNTSYSTVVVQNVGSVAANSFNMVAGACSGTAQAPTGNTYTGTDTSAGFCSKIDVTIEDDTGTATCVYPAQAGACPAASNTYNLTTLAAAYPAATPLALTAPLAVNGSRTYKVSVMVDTSATNADQGMQAQMPITFNFGS